MACGRNADAFRTNRTLVGFDTGDAAILRQKRPHLAVLHYVDSSVDAPRA